MRVLNAPLFLLERFSGIYRHRTLAAVLFMFVVGLVMSRSLLTTPQYQVLARIEMDPVWAMMMAGPNAGNQSIGRDPARYYRTQMFILRDPGLAETTLGELDLSAVPEYGGASSSDAGARERIRAVLAGLPGALFGWMRPTATPTPATGSDVPPATELALPAVGAEARTQAEHFANRVLVERVGETQMIDVTFSAAEPVFAAEALNAHVEGYVRFILDRHVSDSDRSLAWLDAEMETQLRLLESSQRALVEYRADNDSPGLAAGDSDLISARLLALNERFIAAERERRSWEAQHEQVRELDPDSPATTAYPVVAQDRRVEEALQQRAELESERTALAGRYGERHPAMVELNGRITAATAAVRSATASAIQTVRARYQTALEDEQSIKREFERQQTRALELGRKNIGYEVLEREADANRRVYESLLEQQKQLMVAGNIRTSNVKVVDRAEVPTAPFSPNTRRDLFMAIVAGLIFSIGFVSAIEYLDDTIKTPDDVTRRLGLPVMSLVPTVRLDDRLTAGQPVPGIFGEAFRQLRTAVVFRPDDGSSTRVIGMTSTQPFEGKTLCACHLAQVLALGGKRVLLMDADLRRPAVHRQFGLTNDVGLSTVLLGDAKLRDAIQRTHDPQLFVCPAGPTPPDPALLLTSDRFHSFVETIAHGPFDWIIADMPPILGVADTKMIASAVRTLLLVLGSGMTRAAHTTRALEMLPADAGVEVVGVVLNRVDRARDRYHYSRYYGSHAERYHDRTSDT